MTDADAPGLPSGLPPTEIEADPALIRALLGSQHPDLADLDLRPFSTGWDNTTFRLGEHLAVRVPRIEAAVPLLLKEQHWLPRLAARLPVPVPAPIRVGRPSPEFPWPWSVVPWVAGRSAEHEPLSPAEAATFGHFLAALHEPATPETPHNDYRGLPLRQVTSIEPRLDRFEGVPTGLAVSLSEIRERWYDAKAAPADVGDTLVHGDLHPKNLVVDAGRLASVLDWGDMTAGDPAIDLAAAWMLFPTEVHGDVWAGYGPVSADTIRRAGGWAVFFGVNLLDTGLANDPPFAEIGRTTLERLCRQ